MMGRFDNLVVSPDKVYYRLMNDDQGHCSLSLVVILAKANSCTLEINEDNRNAI